jgi:transcriptional regulator with XRE-family HTH domain
METRRERLIRLRGGRSHEEIGAALSQSLGRKIGKGTVWKWEQSDDPNIDLEVFFALADFYEVDARELATGEPPRDGDVPPNMLALIADYSVIDEETRGPIRALIRALADRAGDKPPPRKVRNKNKREPNRERRDTPATNF